MSPISQFTKLSDEMCAKSQALVLISSTDGNRASRLYEW